MNLWHADGGIYLGYGVKVSDQGAATISDKPLRYTGDRHLIIIGPNGSGKSRRLLLPNLANLTHWSMIVIDPKGALMKMCAAHRERANVENVIFNPFNLFGMTSRGFNPLQSLDPASEEFQDDAVEQAEAIVEVGDTRETHWPLSFQDFLAAVEMYVRLVIPGGSYSDVRALITLPHKSVRDLVMGGPDTDRLRYEEWRIADNATREKLSAMYAAYTNMRDGVAQPYNPPFAYKNMLLPGMIAAGIELNWEEIGYKAQRFSEISQENRELTSIISTGITATRFLDSRKIKRDLSGPTFDFMELKRRPITVWIVPPDRRIATYAQWMRLVLTVAIQQLMNEAVAGAVPVMIWIDDAAAIGHVPIIEHHVAQFREYGIKLGSNWQGLDQLRVVYGRSWESFIGNAGVFQCFAPQDVGTAAYVSERAGVTTREATSRTVNINLQKRADSYSSSAALSQFQAPLMLPQHIRAMDEGHTLLFSDRLGGEALRTYLPFPTELPGLEAICALDPARN